MLRTLEAPPSRGGSAALAWSADGRTLLALHPNDGGCLLWNAADGKTIARIAWGGGYCGWVRLYDAATGKRQRALGEGEPWPNTTFAWSMTGPSIAWSENWKTSLSSVDTGQSFATLKDAVGPLAWSPDGKFFSRDRRNMVKPW